MQTLVDTGTIKCGSGETNKTRILRKFHQGPNFVPEIGIHLVHLEKMKTLYTG